MSQKLENNNERGESHDTFLCTWALYPENYSLSIQKVKLRKDSDATRIRRPTEKKSCLPGAPGKGKTSRIALKKIINFSFPCEGSQNRGGSWTRPKANIINSYMYQQIRLTTTTTKDT